MPYRDQELELVIAVEAVEAALLKLSEVSAEVEPEVRKAVLKLCKKRKIDHFEFMCDVVNESDQADIDRKISKQYKILGKLFDRHQAGEEVDKEVTVEHTKLRELQLASAELFKFKTSLSTEQMAKGVKLIRKLRKEGKIT